jgi:hypothetical protein
MWLVVRDSYRDSVSRILDGKSRILDGSGCGYIFFLNNYFSKNFVVGVLGLGMKSNEVG